MLVICAGLMSLSLVDFMHLPLFLKLLELIALCKHYELCVCFWLLSAVGLYLFTAQVSTCTCRKVSVVYDLKYTADSVAMMEYMLFQVTENQGGTNYIHDSWTINMNYIHDFSYWSVLYLGCSFSSSINLCVDVLSPFNLPRLQSTFRFLLSTFLCM